MCSGPYLANYKHLLVEHPAEHVVHVKLNRPEKRNALNQVMWGEMHDVFQALAHDFTCRAIVLTGNGKGFCSGIDLQEAASEFLQPTQGVDVGRVALKIRRITKKFQDAFTAMETCLKPVLCGIHGACVGAGFDMICAADIRYATSDAFFMVKEVNVGIAADVGTLQRLPKIVGNESLVREWCFTGRRIPCDEALKTGLLSNTVSNAEELTVMLLELANTIAQKSPVAVQGTKMGLVYGRDHSVQEGLEHMVTWNQSMLQSEDIMKAAMAELSQKPAEFKNA